MRKIKKLSVIVTAHNKDKYIDKCLRSLINQSLDKEQYELIIVNDGSEDNTKFIINLFINPEEDFIRFIDNKKNIGLPASLNKAIKFSRGMRIVRVDADDYVSKDFLYMLLYFSEKNNYMRAIACDYLVFDDKDKSNNMNRVNCFEYPIGCGIIFLKKDLIKIGMYDPSFLINEEADLRIRFEKKNKIYHLELPLYRYRKHHNNMTKNKKELEIYNKKLLLKHPNCNISKKYFN